MASEITSDASNGVAPASGPGLCPLTLPPGSTGQTPPDPLPAAIAGSWLAVAVGFWTKINNDWIFNLAGLLAYNFLMALFPVLLLLLAGCGVVLQVLSPSSELQLQHAMAEAFPGTTGAVLVAGVAAHLKRSVGLLLAIGFVSAFVAGSRLFITLEGCFGIVFRLRGRDPLRQNRMAFGMLALFLIVVPLISLVSIVPAGLVALVDPQGHSPLAGLLSNGARLAVWLAAALLFFSATYAFVPNSTSAVAHVATELARGGDRDPAGGAVRAALSSLSKYLLHADNYGTIAAFAIVILLFLYYLAFILLLGAEINSWAAGQREAATDLPGMLHAVQVHRTLRGAAGPTAGLASEEMQRHHSRAWLVRYAEAVLRRSHGGSPLNLRLPRFRRASDQSRTPQEKGGLQ